MPQTTKLAMFLFLGVAHLVGCSDTADQQPRLTEAEVLAIAEPMMAVRFPDSFDKYRPYQAEFHGGKWHVLGTLPDSAVGGTPEAEVRDADGEILHVFHTQ